MFRRLLAEATQFEYWLQFQQKPSCHPAHRNCIFAGIQPPTARGLFKCDALCCYYPHYGNQSINI